MVLDVRLHEGPGALCWKSNADQDAQFVEAQEGQVSDVDPVLVGWKDIANKLGVTTRAARERAHRKDDPLPVRVSHRGVWIFFSALRDWVHRHDMPYKVSVKLRAEERVVKRPGRSK